MATPKVQIPFRKKGQATSDQDKASNDQDRSVRTSRGKKRSSTSQQLEPAGKKEVTMYKLLPQTQVLEEWKSPAGVIHSICPTTDGQVWTSNKYINTLTLQDRKGKIIQQVEHNNTINDTSLSQTTHTLWVCDNKNNIMELVSGQLTHRFSTKVEPRCICVTASNHIIVGMTNNISKFTTQGQMILTTSTTGNEKPLLCSPWRISECPVTHNVAVVDWNDEVDGGDGIRHAVVMDTDFKKLFVYKGKIPSTYKQTCKRPKPTRPKKTLRFNTCGVAYDSLGNLSIGDYYNHRVLLLSGGEKFLGIIYTDTCATIAVGIDREDVLWTVFYDNVKLLQYISV